VTSGTAVLVVVLKAAGIGPGDKVILPACTLIATAGAVVCAGAVPVFADIDESMNIDPDSLGKVVDKYTKAVIPVPILGNPCQMDRTTGSMHKIKYYIRNQLKGIPGIGFRRINDEAGDCCSVRLPVCRAGTVPVGFSDMFYFSKVMKKYKGYRRRNREADQ